MLLTDQVPAEVIEVKEETLCSGILYQKKKHCVQGFYIRRRNTVFRDSISEEETMCSGILYQN
jgi:hypothetical protein